MTLARTLGDFVARTSFNDLPKEVVETTKVHVLDLMGVASLGYKVKVYKPLLDIVLEHGRTGKSTVFGDGRKLSSLNAALVNSFIAHSSYQDDGSRFAGSHPGPVVISAALAIAEEIGANGRDLITAIALGYDVLIRIGRAMNPSFVRRGFQPTPVVACFGSATATSKLLGLDNIGITNAICIASLLSSGLKKAFEATPSQPLQVARSCESGVLAALFAQKGVEGYEAILEDGFLRAFADDYKVEGITRNLGKDYMMLYTYLKKHGGARSLHGSIDAVLELVSKHKISADDVAEIRVKEDSVAMAGEVREPKTVREAQLNTPFAVSLAILEGDAYIETFSDENFSDARIRQFMKKVKVEADPEMDKVYPQKRGSIVEIITKAGNTYRHSVDVPRGDPENPLSKAEVEAKLRKFASGVLEPRRAERIISLVDRLETVEKVSNLVSLLKSRQ